MPNVRLYLVLFGVCLGFAGVSLILTSLLLSPDKLSSLIIAYAVITTFSFSGFVLLGTYIRQMFGQREFVNNYFRTAIRQSAWLTIILVICLVLSSFKLFSFLNAGFLVLAFVFLEFYLSTRKKLN